LSTAGDTPISRRKSFKKSLRESFRRLRKGRNSTRIANDKKGASITPDKKREKLVFYYGLHNSYILYNYIFKIIYFSSGTLSPMEARPVERAIEARPVDDALGSMVRCLSFTKTFIVTGISLFCIYVSSIEIPGFKYPYIAVMFFNKGKLKINK
jgi:lethal(2) giant larvae protein